jgi:hypothetical protein
MKFSYTDRMEFAAYMVYRFIIFFHNLLFPFLSMNIYIYIYIGCMYDLYPSPNIVRMIKSRRMRLTVHVARMGRREACIGF